MTLPAKLSRREREIMDLVFALNQATLGEILDRMEDPPTRPALRSILTILETKGHLQHRKSGREFVYAATHEKKGAGRSALRRVLDGDRLVPHGVHAVVAGDRLDIALHDRTLAHPAVVETDLRWIPGLLARRYPLPL